MRSFDEIEEMARAAHPEAGREFGANDHLKTADDLRQTPDDRWLAQITQAVFRAGFVWKVIEAKWPGFEEAFEGFEPNRVSFFSDDDVARLASDGRIVRNGTKIMATVENARFVAETSAEQGGFGAFLADWPADDQVGLMEVLKKKGSRIGGTTGMYFLRFSGWDAWILSGDVTAALIREGVIDKPATSKTALKSVQSAFNAWAEESGRPRSEISRILALSTGPRES